MDYYNKIKDKLIDNEIYSKTKDYSKERHKVIAYYEIGKLLSEAGKYYGDGIIKEYSENLINDVGKKYNYKTLYKIKQFYVKFSAFSTLSRKLTWSHYSEMLVIKDINEINYYIKICEEQNLAVRDLRNKIKNKEYQRLDEKTKNKLINK